MTDVRIALLQMNAGTDAAANADVVADAVQTAASKNAKILFTPEMTNLLDRDRERAGRNIASEQQDMFLQRSIELAAAHDIWIALGSLALANPDGSRANRSFIIAPDGKIVARYDKMHMFDVDLENGESWRESNAYQAGDEVVTADTPIGRLGLTICYDLRFPALFGALGNRHCDAIAVPSAFTRPTGAAHWHVLQRARAIEASAFVIAAAQVGEHEDGRATYGHSLVIDPWGEVLLDMGGETPGVGFADIDLKRVQQVRRQVPSLANRRPIAN